MSTTTQKHTAAEAAKEELLALGLPSTATAQQITTALEKRYPQGIATSEMDSATGLPYTKATASWAGSGDIVGQIIGTATLGAAGVVTGLGGTLVEALESYANIISTGAASSSPGAGGADLSTLEAESEAVGDDAATDTAESGDNSDQDADTNLAKAGTQPAKQAAETLSDFLGKLWSPLRILYLVLGLILGYLGLRHLANVGMGSSPPQSTREFLFV